jgi:cell division control protein 24
VLNKRGDKEGSLFQICLMLRLRLRALPGFEDALTEEEEEAGEDADPVTILWRFFRRGYPLMDLYNALSPRAPLQVDTTKISEQKRGKACTFKFIQACMKELGMPECFMVTDLYGDDTTGFVKVGFPSQVACIPMLTKAGHPGCKSSPRYPRERRRHNARVE